MPRNRIEIEAEIRRKKEIAAEKEKAAKKSLLQKEEVKNSPFSRR